MGQPGARDDLVGRGQVAQDGVVGDARQGLADRLQRRPAQLRTGAITSEWVW